MEYLPRGIKESSQYFHPKTFIMASIIPRFQQKGVKVTISNDYTHSAGKL